MQKEQEGTPANLLRYWDAGRSNADPSQSAERTQTVAQGCLWHNVIGPGVSARLPAVRCGLQVR